MTQEQKELYYKIMTDCGALIEDCPNEKAGKRVLACEYCRFEYLRKAIAKEILQDLYYEFDRIGDEGSCGEIRLTAERYGVKLED
jgi:hypothetical protein